MTTIHHHHLSEQPKISYVHFRGNDDLARLAQGLRAALDQTNSAATHGPQVAIGK